MADALSNTLQTPNAFQGFVGVARREITPPVGIYARMWGAAKHDMAEGIHKPLFVTALAVRNGEGAVRVLIAADVCVVGDLASPDDLEVVAAPVRERLGLGDGEVLLNWSHTHAAPWAATSRAAMPGGELIAPFLEKLGQAIADAGEEAIATLRPGTLTWATGRCDLAQNRDLVDPATGTRIVCGWNPDVAADDTLVVGRVTDDADGKVVATIVNYACHPTTLSFENTQLSPDYIGAMREVVEGATGGAPCVFLHGASGDLGPAYQYVGDTSVPDQHGRRLGYAALSALEGMLAPGNCLEFKGVVESGAPLAIWRPTPFEPSTAIAGTTIETPLSLKEMPTVAELEAQMESLGDGPDDRALYERLFRKRLIVSALSSDGFQRFPAWIWRIGDSLLIGHPNEAYSCFQEEIREAFPGTTVVVMNTSGMRGMGYLYPPKDADADIYQVWQSPFSGEALPALTAQCVAEGKRLLA
ncbi:MAG: hypothetical protein F2663_07090 [Actinobacteria bacterium]|uniref:Unannotated protein n=1 Tax=freshwater metagenome TaxID=449393 RepID=A0A6J6Q052_9ZZZZ|nr:hypothetical protein [Actinomycetota bacterium]